MAYIDDSENLAAATSGRRGALRLRIGVFLWVCSWIPFGSITLAIARALGADPADQAAHVYLMTTLTIEIVIGVVGVALAGSEAIAILKRVGWKHLPRAVWTILRTGATAPA